MAEMILIRRGDALYPAEQSDLEALRKLKIGVALKGDVKQPRNYHFHKKLFALLNLAFEYWRPDSLISDVERATVDKLCQFMQSQGVSAESLTELSGAFLMHLNNHRQNIPAERSFDCFREYVTIKAGYFDTVITPSGLKRIARSISYASMDDTAFAEYYRQILNVCWQLCLHSVYQNKEQLAEQLLMFE